MIFPKFIRVVFSMLSLLAIVSSHDSRKHEHYSFKDLREAVNGDSLTSEDQQRLFNSLHLLNCSDDKPSLDYRKCFTPKDLHDFEGSPPSKALNSTEFIEISPVIVFCLLPALEKNSGRTMCDLYPKNHSELFNVFARNFSDGNLSITHEALDRILEEINKTIGDFLTKTKCFSAESIINEVKEQEHHEEEGGHHKDEGGHHEEEEEHGDKQKSLDQHDFEKACASIILHLVQGFCIEEGHGHDETESKLPSRDFFISDIFNGTTHLSEGDLEEIMKSLGIGEASSAGDEHTDHDGHNHRRRRAADLLSQKESVAASRVRHRRAVDDHDHDHGHHSTGTCYSLDDLLTVFDIDHSIGADSYDFQQLCPAFIQQAKSGACKAQTLTKTEEEANLGKVWGYGFAAVTVISLTSLAGVATVLFKGKKLLYKKILSFLVALGIGTLAGDSLLHLLPHAFGLHAHEEEGSGGDSHADHSEASAFLWKAVAVLASIYVFFLFETLMHLGLKSKFGDGHGHSHVNAELPGPSSLSFTKGRRCSRFEHHEGVPSFDEKENKEKVPMDNGDVILKNVGENNCNASPSHSFHSHCVYEHVCGSSDTEESEFESTKVGLENFPNGVPRNASGNPKKSLFGNEDGKKTWKDISAVAWMIIIGDTLHNFSDGLAIGAAFSQGGNSGVSGGISTSIAIFCHELPHELGDFAILLTAGMSVKMALLANFLSALSCYIGLAIGIYIGQEDEVRFWIFAIAGGIFLYVALVDMLPDLMHSETLQSEPLVTFLMQNFGLLLGFVIMLIIALHEEDLRAMKF
ncbi:zinc transporter ZIP12-like [Montipora foliosa]|uniref:zinc transporter ZIP12-like n=1 Tax=Montipora foliosa TaxID=591990 RepID=UPI0035F1B15F